tara:strand:+ start:1552 stop:2010 length:459 start_codon:yes stop_codon:yes gene_type:complete
MAIEDKRIVYTLDEQVKIVIPSPKCSLTIEQLQSKKAIQKGVSTYVVDKETIPNDRSFRNAWTFDGSKFGTNMTTAKEIHKNFIREARIQKLKDLDIEFQKALETSASTTDIIAKKKALRDAPADSAIDSASTESDLKKQWNSSILGSSPYS